MDTKGPDFASIPKKAIRVLTSPSVFFREMPRTGGFGDPLIFVIVMGIMGGLIKAVFSLLGLHLAKGITVDATSLIVLPIAIALGSFIGAAILFVIWKLMGSQEPYETAYRCAAYISALTPITAFIDFIPYLGAVVSVALSTYFLVIASVEVHNIPSNKAWLVFGIIGVLFILMNISGQCASRRFMDRPMKVENETMSVQNENEIEKILVAMQKMTEDLSSKTIN